MNVFIIDAKQSKNFKNPNLSEAYSSFQTEVKIENFITIIENEWQTFVTILDKYYTRDGWFPLGDFLIIDSNIFPIYIDDPYISDICNGFNENDAQYLHNNIETLTDIYEKDFEFLNTSSYNKIILLSYNGSYLGHVYLQEDFSIIGIRMSLTYLILKNRGLSIFKNIGIILLDAFRSYAQNQGIEKIYIENPIGPMIHIAEKYGFINFVFNTNEIPFTEIPQYNLYF